MKVPPLPEAYSKTRFPSFLRISLPDIDAAKAWVITYQLGGRNLSREQASYLRGVEYELRKNGQGGDKKAKSQKATLKKTASSLAGSHKVDRATIFRDAQFTRAVDTVAQAAGDDARQAILARDTKLAPASSECPSRSRRARV